MKKSYKQIKREVIKFSTGAQRDDSTGRGYYECLPPEAIDRDAKLYEKGAKQYGKHNWRKGIPSSRFMQSLLRHAFRYLDGDRSEDHMSAIRFNAAGIMYNEQKKKDQHDL